MTDNSSITTDTQRSRPSHFPDMVVDGTIGGVVGILAAILPFSTVLGGATAGYLHSGDRCDGAVVGLLAGAVMMLPAIIGGLALALLSVPIPGPQLSPVGIAALVAAFSVFYVLGPAVVGGIIGVMARRRGWFE